MRKFTKYPSNYVRASYTNSGNDHLTSVKIYDDSFYDDEWITGVPYGVEDYLYDVAHEIDGDYTIIDSSNEVESADGTLFEGFVIAKVSESILDFMRSTNIHFDVV